MTSEALAAAKAAAAAKRAAAKAKAAETRKKNAEKCRAEKKKCELKKAKQLRLKEKLRKNSKLKDERNLRVIARRNYGNKTFIVVEQEPHIRVVNLHGAPNATVAFPYTQYIISDPHSPNGKICVSFTDKSVETLDDEVTDLLRQGCPICIRWSHAGKSIVGIDDRIAHFWNTGFWATCLGDSSFRTFAKWEKITKEKGLACLNDIQIKKPHEYSINDYLYFLGYKKNKRKLTR